MNRAQAYELAKTRGFNKSISAFGGQFTKNPDAVVCGIKRIDKGVFIEVEEETSSSVSVNSENNSITAEAEKESLSSNGKETALLENPLQEAPSAKTTAKNQPSQKVPSVKTTVKEQAEQKVPSPETTAKEQAHEEVSSAETTAKEQAHEEVSSAETTVKEEGEEEVSSAETTAKEQEKSDDRRSFSQQSDRPPRMRRKLYTANGTHQAICRFQGVLMPKPEGEKGFKLLLPNLEVEAHFAFPKTLWYYRQNPEIFAGVKNYIGYPKLTGEGKLVKIQIVAIDQQQSFQKEQWEFIGMWCGPQRALFVQRQGQMFPDEERPHYYKYRFKNQDEYRKYLWDRYAYHVIAKREGDELVILRSNPFACPRRKPEPPLRGGGRPPFQGRPSSSDRPAFSDRPASSDRPSSLGRPSSVGKPSDKPKPSGKPLPRSIPNKDS